MDKLYLDAQQLLEDSCRLAAQVVHSGYRPTHLVALWRGGVPIGIAMQEFLRLCGIPVTHFAIRTTNYAGIGRRAATVSIQGLEEVSEHCAAADRLLLVDDVHDTGITMQALIAELRERAGDRTPREIRIAVPWFKPRFDLSGRPPDYYLHETSAWLMFPHSLEGLSAEEIARNRTELAAILAEARPDAAGAVRVNPD